jgi:glycogen(starch) synthase
MRVLFWSERFWPMIGGVGIAARRLLPALKRRGYEFLVITARDQLELPEEDELEGIPVIRLSIWTALARRDIAALALLRQRIAGLKRSFAPDLVHINFLGPSVFLHSQTRSVQPAPVLVGLDSGLPPPSPGTSFFEETLTSADWVTCVSEASLRAVRQRIPALEDRSSVVRFGIEPPPRDPDPFPRTPHLVCLGRSVADKGFDLALGAFPAVRGRFPDARLTIAGDGPGLSDLKSKADAFGIADATSFPGWIRPSETWSLLESASLVLVPSRKESFGLVALEAALMARPVIAARVGGLPEVVADRETGLLFTSEDSGALAAAIEQLLANPEAAEQMGRRARDRALVLFGWDTYLNTYDELYRRLNSKRRR